MSFLVQQYVWNRKSNASHKRKRFLSFPCCLHLPWELVPLWRYVLSPLNFGRTLKFRVAISHHLFWNSSKYISILASTQAVNNRHLLFFRWSLFYFLLINAELSSILTWIQAKNRNKVIRSYWTPERKAQLILVEFRKLTKWIKSWAKLQYRC